jgi:hypothetical protein
MDFFLGWFVIAVPFIITVGATVLALKLPHERHYWKFVWGAIALGVVFSGLTYLQQSRAISQAARDRDTAIKDTSKQVAKDTTDTITAAMGKQYQGIIDSLTQQVGDLKGQLLSQGKKVDAIGKSPFVTGSSPVRVEVTNPSSQASASPAPVHVGHLTLTQKSGVSTREDAPYMAILTIQSDVEMTSVRIVVTCDGELVAANGGFNGMSTGSSGLMVGHSNMAGMQFSGITPPFGPSSPGMMNIWAKTPVICSNVQTF